MSTYKYITLAALALSFAACSQDEDLAPQNDSDAIRINASIGAMPQSRLNYGEDGATTFEEDDQIRVINQTRLDAGKDKDKSDAIYQYDCSAWSAVSTDVMWEGSGSNTFYGVYPATADYTTFTIPTDQSCTDEMNKITAADWMTADYSGVKSTGDVSLNFMHRLAKVTVKFILNDEFDNCECGLTEDCTILSVGSVITANYSRDTSTGVTTATITSDNTKQTLSCFITIMTPLMTTIPLLPS